MSGLTSKVVVGQFLTCSWWLRQVWIPNHRPDYHQRLAGLNFSTGGFTHIGLVPRTLCNELQWEQYKSCCSHANYFRFVWMSSNHFPKCEALYCNRHGLWKRKHLTIFQTLIICFNALTTLWNNKETTHFWHCTLVYFHFFFFFWPNNYHFKLDL